VRVVVVLVTVGCERRRCVGHCLHPSDATQRDRHDRSDEHRRPGTGGADDSVRRRADRGGRGRTDVGPPTTTERQVEADTETVPRLVESKLTVRFGPSSSGGVAVTVFADGEPIAGDGRWVGGGERGHWRVGVVAASSDRSWPCPPARPRRRSRRGHGEDIAFDLLADPSLYFPPVSSSPDAERRVVVSRGCLSVDSDALILDNLLSNWCSF
jgi:hypothetical protein